MMIMPNPGTKLSAVVLKIMPLAALAIALFVTLPASQAAPNSNDSAPQKEHEQPQKSQDAVATGCLFRRDKPGEFALTTRDAKLFYAESSTIDLGAHVGHTVTIRGTFVPDSQTKNDPDKSPEAQTISVTKLEMLRKSCH
jgi:hypothetical protein